MNRLVVGAMGAALAGAFSLGLPVSGQQPQRRPADAGISARASARRPAAPRTATLQAPSIAVAHEAALPTPEAQNAVVGQYCATCHSDRNKAGGLSLASWDAARVLEHTATAEKMVRKLRAGMMPPPGARRPDAAALAALAEAMETTIDRAWAARPDPGWRPFQRLNRAEYASAVRDLLEIDVDVTAFLPPDTLSHGFDNVADEQTFSPTLMEGYLRAASQISRLAVGDGSAGPTSITYKLGRSQSQMGHVEGAPFGTRGGLSVVHTFPADGTYVFKMNLHYEPLGGLFGRETMSVLEVKEQVEVSINGERVALIDLNTRMTESDPKNDLDVETPPIHVQAGPQRVSAAFIQNVEAPPHDLLMPFDNTLVDVSISYGVTLLPHLREMTVLGPHAVTGISDTPSRRRIFTCRPTAAAEEPACAAQIVRNLASRAYRGTADGPDVDDLMTLYDRGRANGGFEGGIRMALQGILANPRFLFRIERDPATLKAGEPQRVGDPELASRLSFFLWGTVPDEELRKLAAEGRLGTPAIYEKQVRRMLKDPRAGALATRFASQWLRLQDLDKITPDYLLYPNYDATLAQGFRRETELLFSSLVREDRSVLDLLTADYTFVNERVARHYGIRTVAGAGFQRVTVPEERRGILGHGSILTLTSIADRTSPVIRGKWIMEVLLGTPPPAPPPNVPDLEETKAVSSGRVLSVRERMEEHRKNPACTSCHRVIDPLGLALENFDVTGAWRIRDNGVPVDAAGDLYDGTRMDGPVGLRRALLQRADLYLLSFAESLMTYALGRRVEHTDMPAVRAIVREAGRGGNQLSSFIVGVARSAAFQMKQAPRQIETTAAGARE